MRTLLLLLFFLTAQPAFAQTPTRSQAEAFLNAKEERDTLTIPDYSPKFGLFRGKKPGDIVINGKEVYRLIQHKSVIAYNAGYIFLDAKKLSKAELEALSKTILDQYNEGTPFDVLAQDYTMDNNPHPEELKYIDGQMVETFEKAVREHKKGEVFTVETSDNGWFHIVKKNEDHRTVMAVEVEYGYFQ